MPVREASFIVSMLLLSTHMSVSDKVLEEELSSLRGRMDFTQRGIGSAGASPSQDAEFLGSREDSDISRARLGWSLALPEWADDHAVARITRVM